MTTTACRRAAVAGLAGLMALLGTATPALALSDGEQPERGIGFVNALLIFGGIPLAACGLIALLVVAGRGGRGPRYRPGRPWTFAPIWFGGPPDADAAVARAKPSATVTGGGASAEW